jgi:hypothetical protein
MHRIGKILCTPHHGTNLCVFLNLGFKVLWWKIELKIGVGCGNGDGGFCNLVLAKLHKKKKVVSKNNFNQNQW